MMPAAATTYARTMTLSHLLRRTALAAAAVLAVACTAPAPPVPGSPASVATVTGPVAAVSGSARSSPATTARGYRQDAATHLYGLNAQRIYKGTLPPMLYAIGTLEVDLDRAGRVTRLHWLRAPRHAPEVVAEIERTVRAASPFPAATQIGSVTYTDTWLWDKSGRFQLDTLTEGQASP